MEQIEKLNTELNRIGKMKRAGMRKVVEKKPEGTQEEYYFHCWFTDSNGRTFAVLENERGEIGEFWSNLIKFIT